MKAEPINRELQIRVVNMERVLEVMLAAVLAQLPEPASERLKAEIAGGALEIETGADDPKEAEADRATAESEMGAFLDRVRMREATLRTPPRG